VRSGMRYVLFVANDGLDAVEGASILRRAPHARAFRVVCANPDGLTPDCADSIAAATPSAAMGALESLPRPTLVMTVGNTPLALWASMWAAHNGIPTMHHHAGLRGSSLASDRIGIALDATSDLLSFIARRDQQHAGFSSATTRVVGWPSMEAWAASLPSAIGIEPGSSGCLVLLGPASANQYGRIAKVIDACMHACRRFTVYASREFRDTIVRVGVPLPDGFELHVPNGMEEVAEGVAKCKMLVANDERLQALSAVAGCPVVLVDEKPSIRWLAGQGDYVRHVDMSEPPAATLVQRFWECLPDEPFRLAGVPKASTAVMEWIKPFL